MCGRKSKIVVLLLFLLSLSLFFPLCASCFAEVRLTDEEASELMSEIQKSREDLQTAKSELEEQKKALIVVKNIYEEQKKSYEMQLTEVEEKNQTLEKVVTVSTTTAIVMTALTLFLIIF